METGFARAAFRSPDAHLPLPEGAERDQVLTGHLSDSLRLRWVGWVLGQLERRELLAPDSPRPSPWSGEEGIDTFEFSHWLSKHLNVTGWRAILNQIRDHNERGHEVDWDPSSPKDLLDAVELVLQTAYVPMPEAPEKDMYEDEKEEGHSVSLEPIAVGHPGAIGHADMVSDVEERDTALRNLAGMLAAEPRDQQEMRLPAAAWLLAPRSAASVVKARATSAKALAELYRARSEAMLYALHAMENDTRGSAVLAHIEHLRKRLGTRLAIYCREHGISVPAPNTEEEANILLLLNAQLIALDDAQEEIARRGAELSREKIRLSQESARMAIELTALPAQLQGKMATNPVREKLLCEETRHRTASWISRAIGAAGGALTGVATSTTDVLLSSITETATVSGPPLIVFLLTLVAETVGHPGALSLSVVLSFLGTALWNAVLILGLTLTAFAVWRFVDKKMRATNRAERPGPLRDERTYSPDRPWDDLGYRSQA